MNLHRTGKGGEWEKTDPEKRNIWQRTAAKTHGVAAPANAVSLAGLATVTSGLIDIYYGRTARGLVKIIVGRLADIGDGAVAEATKTKSPLGEAADVVIDKVEVAMALPVLVKSGILPRTATGVLVGQNVANTVASAVAKKRGVEIHPSREGKLNTAGQWLTAGLYTLGEIARQENHPDIARGIEIAGHASLAATAYLGIRALHGYAQDALAPKEAAIDIPADS